MAKIEKETNWGSDSDSECGSIIPPEDLYEIKEDERISDEIFTRHSHGEHCGYEKVRVEDTVANCFCNSCKGMKIPSNCATVTRSDLIARNIDPNFIGNDHNLIHSSRKGYIVLPDGWRVQFPVEKNVSYIEVPKF
jgi:hypothetical protein